MSPIRPFHHQDTKHTKKILFVILFFSTSHNNAEALTPAHEISLK